MNNTKAVKTLKDLFIPNIVEAFRDYNKQNYDDIYSTWLVLQDSTSLFYNTSERKDSGYLRFIYLELDELFDSGFKSYMDNAFHFPKYLHIVGHSVHKNNVSICLGRCMLTPEDFMEYGLNVYELLDFFDDISNRYIAKGWFPGVDF